MSAQLSVEIQYVRLDDLHFDPENPRLPISLRGAPETEVFAFLLRECNLIELMLSIGAQGFFPGEPLLCSPRSSGGYTVVEGNRRLAAAKLLLREDPAPTHIRQVASARELAQHKPTELPVIVFGSRGDIITYLGYRHITGVNAWGPLEKARYLFQLATSYPDGPDKFKLLAREIGSRADYVAQTLAALTVVDKAIDQGLFDKYSVNVDAIPFSVLATALSYSAIGEFIGLESRTDVAGESIRPSALEEFFKWMLVEEAGRTRIGESRNLKMLARVVKSERALGKFREGLSLEQADLFTEGPSILLRKTLIELEQKFSIAQDAVKYATPIVDSEVEAAQAIERAAISLRASIQANRGPTQ